MSPCERVSTIVPAAPFAVAMFAVTSLAAQTGGSQIINVTPRAADVTWVKFSDPLEHAFTVDVPKGWTVKGGMYRMGYSDYRPMIDLQSPDGMIDIRSGDVAIPSYAKPTPVHPREGEVADLGAQAQLIFANYRSGKDYAALYALTRWKQSCQSLTPISADPTAPVKETASDPSQQTSAGGVAYRCDSGQSSRTAYVWARTSAVSAALWQVTTLASYLTPPAQEQFTRGILMHVSQSVQVNPQWTDYQKKMDDYGLQYQKARQQARLQQLDQQVREFESRMQAMRSQVNAFERRQAAQAKQVDSFTDTLTGVMPALDPLNGQTRSVWIGPNNGYWINDKGTIVNSNLSPGPGFRQLEPK